MCKERVSNVLISCWKRRSWSDLSLYTPVDLEPFEDRGELALMVGAANLQIGRLEGARTMFKQALGWGVESNKCAYYSLSAVYSMLHLAHILNGKNEQAQAWQACLNSLAVQTGCHALELPGGNKDNLRIDRKFQGKVKITDKGYPVRKISAVNLGPAWSGNTVNTVIFRHHGLFTANDNQFTGFYVDEHTLRLVKRRLIDNQLTTFDLKGDYNLKDAHNIVSLGMDRSGVIHICYDHHGTKLRYRRSVNPHDITAWTEELPMTGLNEEKITYPTFIEPKGNNPLLLLYRDGSWNKGTAYLKGYDEKELRWYDYEEPLLSGSENKPWTSNAYWNHPVVNDDGRLCLTYVWRTDYYNDEKRVNNINLGFAQSYDSGLSWCASNDQAYKLPITQVNSEVIFPVPPGSNLINQTSMALDSKGFPHIAFYCNDANEVPQYVHLWFDGEAWRHNYVSSRTEPFVLAGGGTLKIPISRPDILIDSDDTVFIIYRSEETNQKMTAVRLAPPHYLFCSSNVFTLWDECVGQAEPIVDKLRWEKERVLSLYIQHSEQPDHEGSPENLSAIALIVDFQVTGVE